MLALAPPMLPTAGPIGGFSHGAPSSRNARRGEGRAPPFVRTAGVLFPCGRIDLDRQSRAAPLLAVALMQPALPIYSRAERLTDAIVHAVGLGLAAIGCLVLLATVPPHVDLVPLLALMVYAFGLMAMLGCSALYNLTRDPVRRRRYRRFDHCGIFLMIAGTYTPFTLVALGDTTSKLLLAFVWMVALAGIVLELTGSQRGDVVLTASYIALGWVILVQVGPLALALSLSSLALLLTGGALYTVGAIFHHWRSLPYHNAIWHGFVLAAAACHYLAVLREIAPLGRSLAS